MARNHIFPPIFTTLRILHSGGFLAYPDGLQENEKSFLQKSKRSFFSRRLRFEAAQGFMGLRGFLHGQKTCFRDPGCTPRVNFPAYRVKFWVLNFGQFGQNSPYTLIRTHWWRSRSPFHDSRLRFRAIGEFRRTRRIISSTPLRALRCTRNPWILAEKVWGKFGVKFMPKGRSKTNSWIILAFL